jgi:hypothetical protein
MRSDVQRYGFPPNYEDTGDTIRVEYEGTEAWIMRDMPFGPDVKLAQPMHEGYHTLKHGRDIVVEHTLTQDQAEILWSVLTVVLMEMDPDYTANRLRQLEGEQVARQEA